MPAYKDSKTGTWFVKFYCKDWTGENKQIKKRGFATKREALDYERNYKIRQENNLDMTFGEFWKLYTEDVKNYVKLNTWLTKEHIVDTKILPYFRNLKMNEITPGDVRKWQNEMVAFRYENGKCYSQTYKKTMHNILSAIFNHACRFYNLKSNPARDGIFYPVLVAGTEKADIDVGKYGRMWIKYIKEEYPMRYKSLVRFGELEERADEVNDTAYELLDDIEAKWLKKHKPKNPNSFTEQLQLRTQTRMMAEEIVIMDVVMQFH